jgi:hypothetical protein
MPSNPWPWFDDESGALAQRIAQQSTKSLQNSFLLVINGPHRQVMNNAHTA